MKQYQFTTSIKKLIGSDPKIITLILYLISSAIGMLYEVVLLADFNIYVFHYTKIYGFFLSAFKAWEITAVVFACLVSILYLVFKAPNIQSEKGIRQGLQIRNYTIIFLSILMLLAPYFIAKYRASYVRNDTEKYVNVVLKEKITPDISSINFNRLILISSSEDYFFFFDRSISKPVIIPSGNVLLLQY